MGSDTPPMTHIPPVPRRLRGLALLYGIGVFLWLTPEDDNILVPVLFGAVGATLLVIIQTLQRLGGKSIRTRTIPLSAALLGALAGLLTSPAAALIMLIKNAIHSHLFPDYMPEIFIAVLERTPIWTLAGGLLGLSLSLAWLALRSAEESSQ